MTIKELSALTGFSPSTLSRVLTNNKSVNDETRRKVQDALKQLDYKAARPPRKKFGKKTVMVVTGETSSNFAVKLFATMSAKLRDQGYTVLVGNSGFDERLEEQYVEYAQYHKHSGIIMITPVETPALKRLVDKSPCPIVLVNRYLRSIDMDAVYMDNHRAGYIAATYLLSMGHRRIACLTGGRKSTSDIDRIAGFAAAMADAGVLPEEYLIRDGDLKRDSGSRFGREYLEHHRDHTAVFCLTEPMAHGFVEAVQEAGLAIPEDVSVICVAPMSAGISLGVKLTCVIHDAELLGRTAVDMLLERLSGATLAPRKIVYPPELSIQDSVKKI